MFNTLLMFLIVLLVSTFETFSQIASDEILKRIDSLSKSINLNDPEYNEKIKKGMELIISEAQDNFNISDTVSNEVPWQTESARSSIAQGLNIDFMDSEMQRDFFYMNPYLLIEMDKPESSVFLDSLDNFTNLNILIIKGSTISKKIDFIQLIKNLENKTIHELYIINFKDRMSEIPESINNLKDLKVLGLYGNNIKELPKSIGDLEYLETLYLDLNPIEDLPNSIKKLANLTTLGIAATKISANSINRLQNKYPQIRILSK